MEESEKLFAVFHNIIAKKNTKSAKVEFSKILPEWLSANNKLNELKCYSARVDEVIKKCKQDGETVCSLLKAGLSNLIQKFFDIFLETAGLDDTGPLLDEILEIVVQIFDCGPRVQSCLVSPLCEKYLQLLADDRCTLQQKSEINRSLNLILETCPFTVKEELLKQHGFLQKLKQLFQLVTEVGDYEFQVGVLESLFRLVPRKIRSQYAGNFIEGRSLVDSFLDIRDGCFETDCRVFLNELNTTVGQNARVYSIPCERIILGNKELSKPKDDDYEEFWVDFNYGTRRITLFCEQDMMEVCSQMSRGELDLWETVSISVGDVNSYKYTENEDLGIACIELKNDVASLCPNIQNCAGQEFCLHVHARYNIRKALMGIFGIHRCSSRKVSSVIMPVQLHVENNSPANQSELHSHNSGIKTQEYSLSQGSIENFTPAHRKMSVPREPMWTPAGSVSSIKSNAYKPPSISTACQVVKQTREKKLDDRIQASDVSMNASKVSSTPKTPNIRVARPKVKTPVVVVQTKPIKMKEKSKQLKDSEIKLPTESFSADTGNNDEVIPDSFPSSQTRSKKHHKETCKKISNLSDSGIDLSEANVPSQKKIEKRQIKCGKEDVKQHQIQIEDSSRNTSGKSHKKKSQRNHSVSVSHDIEAKHQGNSPDFEAVSSQIEHIDVVHESLVIPEKSTTARICEEHRKMSIDHPELIAKTHLDPILDLPEKQGTLENAKDVSSGSKDKGSMHKSDSRVLHEDLPKGKKKKKLLDQYSSFLYGSESATTQKACIGSDHTGVPTKSKKCEKSKAKCKERLSSTVTGVNEMPEEWKNLSKSVLLSRESSAVSSPGEKEIKRNYGDKNSRNDNLTVNTTSFSVISKKGEKKKDKNPERICNNEDLDHAFNTDEQYNGRKKKTSKKSKQESKTNKERKSTKEKPETKLSEKANVGKKSERRVLPGRKAKENTLYTEMVDPSLNTGYLFESPSESMNSPKCSNHSYLNSPRNNNAKSDLDKSQPLSKSGLYFPVISPSIENSDPYDFDAECERLSQSESMVKNADSDTTANMKENGISTSKFFKHRAKDKNRNAETIATNYMKSWHQKLNMKKGKGKTEVFSQSVISWKSVNKVSDCDSTKKQLVKHASEKHKAKSSQKSYVKKTSVYSAMKQSHVEETEEEKHHSVSIRDETQTSKFNLFNPELSMMMPGKPASDSPAQSTASSCLSVNQEETTTKFKKNHGGLQKNKNANDSKHLQQGLHSPDYTREDLSIGNGKVSKRKAVAKRLSSPDGSADDLHEKNVIDKFSAVCKELIEKSCVMEDDIESDVEICRSEPVHQVSWRSDIGCLEDSFQIANDLKSELSWIAKKSAAKKRKNMKTYKRQKQWKQRVKDDNSELETEAEDTEDDQSDGNEKEDDDNDSLDTKDIQDDLPEKDNTSDNISSQELETRAVCDYDDLIVEYPSLPTPTITPKRQNCKRRYSPLDVSIAKTPVTPASIHSSSEGDEIKTDIEDDEAVGTIQEKVYSLPLKICQESSVYTQKLLESVKSGPSSLVRRRQSSLKRKYSHLNLEEENESDIATTPEKESDLEVSGSSFCPRKLFDLQDNELQYDEEPVLKKSCSKKPKKDNKYKVSNLKATACVTPSEQHATSVEDDISTYMGDTDLTSNMNVDSGVTAVIQAFGIDIKKQLQVKHQQLATVTKSALKKTHKHIGQVWMDEFQSRTNAVEHFKDKMLEELLALEADITALKHAEEKSLLFCQEQMKTMEKQRISQESRLKNLQLLHSSLQDDLTESDEYNRSKQHELRQVMKKDMAAMQRRLLFESNQHQMSNMKRCLKSMLF